jgi:hypothetical protein
MTSLQGETQEWERDGIMRIMREIKGVFFFAGRSVQPSIGILVKSEICGF